jgi:hypothetical protein
MPHYPGPHLPDQELESLIADDLATTRPYFGKSAYIKTIIIRSGEVWRQ